MVDGTIVIDTKIDDSHLKSDLKKIGTTVGTWSKQASNVANKALAGIAIGLTSITGAIGLLIKSSSKIENAVANFTPLLKSVDKARKLVTRLNTEASTTPFKFEGISKVASQLLPVMNGSIEDTANTFRMLGDTAGGSIEKLTTITNGYTKSLLKGKPDMESLNMIGEAGVPIFTEMAKTMGVTKEAFFEMSRQGKLTNDDLTETFRSMTSEGGIFFNGMAIASQTLTGKWSTLVDNVTLLSARMGNNLLSSIKKTVDGFTQIVKSQDGFDDFTDTVDNIIKGFNMWAFEANGLVDMIKTLSEALMFVLKNDIIQITAIIAIAIKTVALLAGSFTGIIGIINLVAIGIGALVLGIKAFNSANVEKVEKQFGTIADSLGTNSKRISEISDNATKWLDSGLSLEESIERTMSLYDATREEVIKSLNANEFLTAEEQKQITVLMNQIKQKEIWNALNSDGAKIIKLQTAEEIEKQRLIDETIALEQEAVKQKYRDHFQLVSNILDESKLKSTLIKEEIRNLNSLKWAKSSSLEESRLKALELKKAELAEALLLEISSVQQIENIRNKSQMILQAQQDSGFISQKQGLAELLILYRSTAEALFALGLSPDKLGTEGEQVLFDTLDTIGKLKTAIKLSGLPAKTESLGRDISKSLARGIVDNTFMVLHEVRGLVQGIASTVTKGLEVTKGLFSGFFNVVDFLANFSVKDILDGLADVLSGLDNFFTNELFNITNMFVVGAEMISTFVEGINDNKDMIFEQFGLILSSLAQTIIDNKELFGSVAEIMAGLAIVILESIPELLTAVIEVGNELTRAIIDNADIIVDALFEAIIAIVKIVSENLGEMTVLGVFLVLAIVEGIIANLPEIAKALVEAIPDIVMAIVDNLPEIVEAFARLIPLIVLMLIESFPQLLVATVQMIGGLMTAIGETIRSTPELLTGFFTGLRDGFVEGFESLGDSSYNAFIGAFDAIVDFIQGLLDKIDEVKKSISEDLPKSISKISDTTAGDVAITVLTGGLNKVFGFASGSANIERDQLAQIHKGEKIVPKTFNDSIMSGETIMLNSKAMNSILMGLGGGLNMPSMSNVSNSTINLIANIKGDVTVDGEVIGRIAYQYLDKFAGGSFGT